MEQHEIEAKETPVTGEVSPISEKKLAANRQNAQLSTGPRTEEGKVRSRRNALKHGVLASKLLVTDGQGAEDPAAFERLFTDLHIELAPVGEMEEIMVEKIAVCLWRLRRALQAETGSIRRGFLPTTSTSFDRVVHPERAQIKDHLLVPSSEDLNRILRYETAIHRQLAYAINQLERLQRSRKGENVPAPVTVQLSSDR